MSDDRTVHAEGERIEIVRYNRAGKWWIEPKTPDGGKRQPVTLREAVGAAINLVRAGGSVHFGRPGGAQFDAAVRRSWKGAR